MGTKPSVPDGTSRSTERGLAHDLRNLLTAIDGHAQLARAALADDHPAREDVDEVLAATSRAHQLTESLMAGPGAAVPPSTPLPLDDLVRGFLPLLAAVVGPSTEVEVTLSAPQRVRISRLRLERVLLNLCLNARDSMSGGGRITIAAAERPDGRLEVIVRDTGPGIDPAVLVRLLGPDGQSPVGFDGHGLGLATSRALLEEARGTLEVETSDGVGTTMHAILPRAS